MKQSILLLALLFIQYNTIFAQSFYEKGWVVTKSGDTLKGFIADENHARLSEEVIFKTHKNAQPQHFTPIDIRSFFIEPNQYFESHPVTIYDSGSFNTNKVRQFLYRTEAGYVSVFTLPINNLIFIKKQGDTTVQPLFWTVTRLEGPNKDRIDTLTTPNFEDYDRERLMFSYNYLNTLAKAFNRPKPYDPKDVKLEESAIIHEVKKYNQSFHLKFQPQPSVIKQKWRPIWAIGLNYITPVNQKGYVENADSYFNKNITSPNLWGYEIVGGLYGRHKMKGVSFEVGYNKMSKISYNYSRSYLSFGTTPQYFDGEYESKLSYISLRLTYTASITTKISPYFSVVAQRTTQIVRQFEKERATNWVYVDETFPYKDIDRFYAVGCQYTPNRQHVFRAEINFTQKGLKEKKTLFRAGYQYRFWH